MFLGELKRDISETASYASPPLTWWPLMLACEWVSGPGTLVPTCDHGVTALRIEAKTWGWQGWKVEEPVHQLKLFYHLDLWWEGTHFCFPYVVELGLLLFEAENFLTDTSAFDKLQLPSPTPCFLSGSNSRLAFLLAGLGFLLIFSWSFTEYLSHQMLDQG